MYIVYKQAHGNQLFQAVLHDQVWNGNRAISTTSDVDPQCDYSPGLAEIKNGKKSDLVLANKGTGTSEVGTQIYVSELS